MVMTPTTDAIPAAPEQPGPAGRRPGGTRVRADIQGLRAIAVVLVLIYHLSPVSLPGGYIGVDVFFVISGFLITSHILRELEKTGTVDLPRFWARRARRLLPAALLVLVVTLFAVWIFAPSGFVPAFLAQIAASAVYVQNWMLSSQSVDYMANSSQASPVQHYWTLSVEEQFYIVWPVVAVIAALIASKWVRRNVAVVFGVVIGVILVASLVTSVLMTGSNPSRAYFDSFARAWEFAAGGLLAVIVASSRNPLAYLGARMRVILTWLGLAGILASALWFTDRTPFPGWVALLPVLGTLLVIIGDEAGGRASPQQWLSTRPMQWLGDISYGMYLWHFPLIVLVPFLLGRGITFIDGVAITVATLVLAWASKVLIEDPFRTGAPRTWRNGRTLIVTSAAMAAVLAMSMVGIGDAEERVAEERAHISAQLLRGGECLGPMSQRPDSDCIPHAKAPPIPEPALVDGAPKACLGALEGAELLVCEYGAAKADAKRTIALVGDSHAEQWLMALERITQQEQWRLIIMSKASCPFTAAERDYRSVSEAVNESFRTDCAEWNRRALTQLEEDGTVDTIVTSAKSTNRFIAEDSQAWREEAAASYVERWKELPPSVEHVIAIRDTPQLSTDVISCVSDHSESAPEECAEPLEDAFFADPLAEAAADVAESASTGSHETPVRSHSPETTLIDLTEYFVVDDEVPPVIGGVLAFRDDHHLSWAYSELLADPLREELHAALAQE